MTLSLLGCLFQRPTSRANAGLHRIETPQHHKPETASNLQKNTLITGPTPWRDVTVGKKEQKKIKNETEKRGGSRRIFEGDVQTGKLDLLLSVPLPSRPGPRQFSKQREHGIRERGSMFLVDWFYGILASLGEGLGVCIVSTGLHGRWCAMMWGRTSFPYRTPSPLCSAGG